tara:strand:+ start:456 stop:884 length:429 start_codon:yes stop_codon:yes gene_type:complete
MVARLLHQMVNQVPPVGRRETRQVRHLGPMATVRPEMVVMLVVVRGGLQMDLTGHSALRVADTHRVMGERGGEHIRPPRVVLVEVDRPMVTMVEVEVEVVIPVGRLHQMGFTVVTRQTDTPVVAVLMVVQQLVCTIRAKAMS